MSVLSEHRVLIYELTKTVRPSKTQLQFFAITNVSDCFTLVNDGTYGDWFFSSLRTIILSAFVNINKHSKRIEN